MTRLTTLEEAEDPHQTLPQARPVAASGVNVGKYKQFIIEGVNFHQYANVPFPDWTSHLSKIPRDCVE